MTEITLLEMPKHRKTLQTCLQRIKSKCFLTQPG